MIEYKEEYYRKGRNAMYEFITSETLAEYETFIEAHQNGHFMQSHLWAGCKTAWEWAGIAVRNGEGAIVGALSVLIRRVPGLPFSLLYGGRGPVCDRTDREVLAELAAGARTLAKKHGGYLLKIDPDVLSSSEEEIAALNAAGFRLRDSGKNFEGIQPRYVFRLHLNGRTEEEIFAAFEQKTRYNVRLSGRKGVEVRLCGEEMVESFAAIMRETGERDGFIVRNADYFRRMLQELGEHARLYMAFYEDKPVAGTLAIGYGNKVWYLYGASSNTYRNVMPNYALQWEMIRWAVERGADIYDFRGVSGDLSEDNPLYGLYRFKKGFNGDFTEFAGEFDLAFRPFLAWGLEKGQHLWRRARAILRGVAK